MYLMVVVGGAGYFFGPLLGSAVGVLLPEWLRFAQAWYLFAFGTAVVMLMLSFVLLLIINALQGWSARRVAP